MFSFFVCFSRVLLDANSWILVITAMNLRVMSGSLQEMTFVRTS